MPRKRKKLIDFEDMGGFIVDDAGVRRDINVTYPGKFTYRGHANIFRISRSHDGESLAAVACEGEISTCFIEEKGGWSNLTDEDLDRRWEETLITENQPPFNVSYTLRAKRRFIRDLYEIGRNQALRRDRDDPPAE